MLIVHKIIDGLRGARKYPAYSVVGVSKEEQIDVAKRIVAAEKFDFGHPPMESDPSRQGHWIYPNLTPDEVDWWREGFIPLPAPACWFELEIGGTRTGFLVTESPEEEAWIIERIDLTKRGVLYDGVQKKISRSDPGDVSLRVRLNGNPETLDFYRRNGERYAQISPEQLASETALVIYLALMLNSRTTQKRVERASRSPLSASRVRRGRAPLSDHLVVRIVPEQYTGGVAATGRTHRSPRLHWRRSHLRHYEHPTPSSKWAEDMEHNGRKGWWVAVIPRALVGREDLGEISHTYWVPPTGGAALGPR
jgi:hypothetical protein